jgi:hypothetical protein
MLADWIYTHPIWIVGSLIVVIFILLSLAGLVIVQRFIPVKIRHAHNDVVGFTIAVVGVVYAVLLAFIAVTAWETFRKSDNIVGAEANYVGDVFLNTIGLPDDLAHELRGHLNNYIDAVIEKEWPAQQAGRFEETTRQKGWDVLADFHRDIARFRPANAGEAVLQGQLLRSLSGLYDARRGRLLAAEEHVNAVVWWIIALGAMLTVSFTYLFGLPNFIMHAVITAMLAASLAFVVVLIVAHDYPFRGSPSVSNEAFRAVKKNMETFVFRHH